jgi:hypothetical protein
LGRFAVITRTARLAESHLLPLGPPDSSRRLSSGAVRRVTAFPRLRAEAAAELDAARREYAPIMDGTANDAPTG